MNVRIYNQGQPEIDPSANSKSGSTQSANSAGSAHSAASSTQALHADQDTASISAVTTQLSGEAPIRQDRVEALRAQVESGTYTVDAHAVATAMFQNLFRS